MAQTLNKTKVDSEENQLSVVFLPRHLFPIEGSAYGQCTIFLVFYCLTKKHALE